MQRIEKSPGLLPSSLLLSRKADANHSSLLSMFLFFADKVTCILRIRSSPEPIRRFISERARSYIHLASPVQLGFACGLYLCTILTDYCWKTIRFKWK